MPEVVAAGFTAVSVDLRGHCDGDVGFGAYGDVETAEDLAAHLAEVSASLRRPGHAAAFATPARTLDHDPVEACPGEVRTPTLVAMGSPAPDVPDPAVEAQWIAQRLDGEVLMVPEADHYPRAQRPDLVGPAVVDVARACSRRCAAS